MALRLLKAAAWAAALLAPAVAPTPIAGRVSRAAIPEELQDRRVEGHLVHIDHELQKGSFASAWLGEYRGERAIVKLMDTSKSKDIAAKSENEYRMQLKVWRRDHGACPEPLGISKHGGGGGGGASSSSSSSSPSVVTVMEYLPGGEVFDALTQTRLPRDPEAKRALFKRLFELLVSLKEAGVGHYDIYTSNIVYGVPAPKRGASADSARLIDFGQATDTGYQSEYRYFPSNTKSPEQFYYRYSKGKTSRPTPASDIWSTTLVVDSVFFDDNPPNKFPAGRGLTKRDQVLDSLRQLRGDDLLVTDPMLDLFAGGLQYHPDERESPEGMLKLASALEERDVSYAYLPRDNGYIPPGERKIPFRHVKEIPGRRP